MTKKKILTAVVAVGTLLFGALSLNKCPWLQKQWAEKSSFLLREAGSEIAPVTSE